MPGSASTTDLELILRIAGVKSSARKINVSLVQ
jgi:hypothetical protein